MWLRTRQIELSCRLLWIPSLTADLYWLSNVAHLWVRRVSPRHWHKFCSAFRLFTGKKHLGHLSSGWHCSTAAAHVCQHYCTVGPVWPLLDKYTLATNKCNERTSDLISIISICKWTAPLCKAITLMIVVCHTVWWGVELMLICYCT